MVFMGLKKDFMKENVMAIQHGVSLFLRTPDELIISSQNWPDYGNRAVCGFTIFDQRLPNPGFCADRTHMKISTDPSLHLIDITEKAIDVKNIRIEGFL